MTRAARAPGAGTAMCRWQHQQRSHAEEEGALVVSGASSVSSVPVSFLMSWKMFLVVNSPVQVSKRSEGEEIGTYSVFVP